MGKLLRTYPSRQAFHQAAAGALGAPPSDVEDFFNHSSRRIKFTAEGLRNLERLVKERRKMELRISYLGSEGTRKLADRLAGSANAVYRAWEADPDNLTLKRAYRKMRLQLIHAMKQRWTLSDWEDAEADSETVELDEDALIDDGFLEDE